MPDTYTVKLSDGRTVKVQSDHEPSESEILSALGSGDAPKPYQGRDVRGDSLRALQATSGGEDQADAPNHPILDALSHAAYPQSAGDMLSLLIPSGVAETAGTAARMLKSGFRGAGEQTGVTGRLRGFMGGLIDDANGTNAAKQSVIRMQTTPNTSGYTPGPVPEAPGEALPGLTGDTGASTSRSMSEPPMSVGQREAYRIAAQRAREADQASLVTPKGADILGRVKPPPVAPEMPPELSQMQSTWQQAAAQRSQQMKAAEPFLQAVELGAPKGSYSANFVRSLREQIAQGRNLSQSQMQTLQNLSTQLPPDTQHEILRLLTEQMSQK